MLHAISTSLTSLPLVLNLFFPVYIGSPASTGPSVAPATPIFPVASTSLYISPLYPFSTYQLYLFVLIPVLSTDGQTLPRVQYIVNFHRMETDAQFSSVQFNA